MTLVASAPTSSTPIAVVAIPRPGTCAAGADVAVEQALEQRRGQAVHDAEQPDEGGHGDEQRHRDEEAGDEAASKPLHQVARSPRDGTARSRTEPDDDAVPRKRREARPPHHREERLDDDRGRDEGHDEADRDLGCPVGGRDGPAPRGARERTPPTIVGIARKNENSAAAERSRPMTRPPTIVAPERETPGTSASVWHNADAEGAAAPARRRHRSPSAGGRNALDDQHDHAAEDERGANHRQSSRTARP